MLRFLQHCTSFTLDPRCLSKSTFYHSLFWTVDEEKTHVKIRAGRSFTYYCHRQNRLGEIDQILYQGNQSRIMGINTKSLNNVVFQYCCKQKLTHIVATGLLNSSLSRPVTGLEETAWTWVRGGLGQVSRKGFPPRGWLDIGTSPPGKHSQHRL